jgi:hypothetical protein
LHETPKPRALNFPRREKATENLTIFLFLTFLFDLQVDSARRHGILLEAVQVLTDLNLSIKKAYISSDASWFMDGKKAPPKVFVLGAWFFPGSFPNMF